MTDRVYPSSKPNGTTKTTAAAATTAAAKPKSRLPPPPIKTQIQKPINRHPHRPNPTAATTTRRRRSRRGCFCLCCFWSTLVLTLLLLIAAVAGCLLYLLYRPHRPEFSIAALKISEFNLTTAAADDDTTTRLTATLNLTISARNPNKKIQFHYDPIEITCLSHGTRIANGSFPNPLASDPNNITVIRSTLHGNSLILETETVNQLRSDIKKKNGKKPGLPLKIFLDTEAQVKIESIRTKKVGIRIKCEGIHGLIPKNGGGKSRNSSTSVSAIVSGAKCKMDLRVKIWKWTF